jgi:hypothetical protein
MKTWREKVAAWQEKMDAETVAIRAETKALREEMAVLRNKWVNDNRDETFACQEMEARQEEKKPTSTDRKPEAAQKDEVPAESAKVMPVGEPKKKRRKDRKLAAECRRQEPKCGPPMEVAVARRGTSHRATVARQKDKRIDIGMSRRATVTRRKIHIVKSYITQEKCRPRRELVASRTRTTHRAKVARRKENSFGRDRTRDEVILGTSKGWTFRRDNGRNRNVTRETRIKPYR